MYERRRRIQTLESTKKILQAPGENRTHDPPSSRLGIYIQVHQNLRIASGTCSKFGRILYLLEITIEYALFCVTFRWQSVLHFFQIFQLSMLIFFLNSNITRHVVLCFLEIYQLCKLCFVLLCDDISYDLCLFGILN